MSERPTPAARAGKALPVRRRHAPVGPCSFGDFVLDTARWELRRSGVPVRIEPRVLDLLAYLVRHRDRVVSRDEILDTLWAGETVSDAALSYCVKGARKAVGDSGSAQHTIATVQRRGFRFVAAVTEERAPEPAPPLAPAVAPAPGGFFVGREAVMARLCGSLTASRSGHSRVVLLAGEPGIGKTRIAEELSRAACGEGVVVLTGRCHEGIGAPPFWPWVQVVRSWVERFGHDAAVDALHGVPPELAALVPEVAARPGTARPPASALDSRLPLFDGAAAFLRRATAAQPLLLVFDDLQWADAASLLLLRFIARELADAPILLLAVYRDTDVGPAHPLAACAADLARVAGTEHVQLDGLTPTDLGRFIEATTGSVPSPSLVQAVHEQTGGNPFFATESVRLLAGAGARAAGPGEARLPVPRTVREVVLQRLESLSPAAQALLRGAAVMGREFDLAGVRRIRDERHLPSREDLLGALDEALAARLVERFGAEGRFRFSHDLVRETLYDHLPSDLRASLHERVGLAIEAAHRDDPGPHLAALAHHFTRACVGGDPRRAIAYAVRAGDRAAAMFAYEEAASHYERALDLTATLPAARARERRARSRADAGDELLLALGENQWKSGDFGRARESFERAAQRARATGNAELLARAALGFGGGFRGFDVHVVDPQLVALLEEAFDRLPAEPSPLRVRVMARLGIALYDVPGSLDRRRELSSSAVREARRTRDRAALGAALYCRHWSIWGPDTLHDRIDAARAMVRLAAETGDRETALHGHRFLAVDSLESGDREGLDANLARCEALAEQLRQPYYRWYAAQLVAIRALLDGDVAGSERLLDEAAAIGRRAESRNVELGYRALLFSIRREQGRLHEVEPGLREVVDRLPGAVSWRCGLMLLCAELGRLEEARHHLEGIARDDFAAVSRNAFWLAAIVMSADACAAVGDPARARAIYRLLLPYRDRVAEVAIGGGCLGSVERPLGSLASLLGMRRQAAAHFARALRVERGLRAPLLVARTEQARAAALGDGRAAARER